MNTLQRILISGGTDLRYWYKTKIKRPLILWWEKKTNFNPYGVWPSGACPVQAEGFTKDGKWYYFRSRGMTARIVICKSEEDYGTESKYLFERELQYGTDFQAGWMSHEDAVRLATVWLNEYYEEMQKLDIDEGSFIKSRSSK